MATTVRTMTGSEVKTLRVSLGMTQEDLAHELGVTVSTVNRWENGHTRPSRLATAGLDRLASEKSWWSRPSKALPNQVPTPSTGCDVGASKACAESIFPALV